MKILMLVNWKVEYAAQKPEGKQPPDYYVKGEPYWFFRYFKEPVQVDVLDVHSFEWLERFEKNQLRFYVWQTLRALPKLHRYDLILSHGAQSGVALSLWRRLFRGKAKHILFDIGAFNSAAERGTALKLMQAASRSLDGVIFHTSNQLSYYRRHFPWLVEKAKFIPFGTDSDYFVRKNDPAETQNYMICVGYQKRDWETLIRAYRLFTEQLEKKGKEIPELRLIGKPDKAEQGREGYGSKGKIRQIPFLPLEELIQSIQAALFAVLPLQNFNYSFGQMTLLQQMALGKAVITARVPSMVDYIDEGKTGLFYEAGNERELCDRMLLLYADDRLRLEIGRGAAEYVQYQYNEKKMAVQIECFLKEAVKKK